MAAKEQDRCTCCRQPLRLECPVCRMSVRIEAGHYASHPKSEVMGGHIEWKTCPRSGKAVQP